MAAESRLVRQWILLRLIASRRYGVTVKEMAEELNVGLRTVQRDLETFVRVGFPLEETVHERGLKRWRLDPAKAQPGLSFAFDEAIALYLGRRLLEPLAGTIFWDAAQRAFRKIRASLGESALKYMERFAPIFHQTTVGTSDYSKKAELIDELMRGIEDRRATFITYRSLRATESVSYDVYSYGLAYHHGSLYLIGWSPEHKAIRHWKVDRMESAEVTDFPFPWPKGFNLQDHLRNSFGIFQGDGEAHVTVRFSPAVSRYVQELNWHDSQRFTREKDGTLLAEFDLDGTEEIKRWILSFGRHAEVLEPVDLLREIRVEVQEMSQAYASHADELAGEPRRRQRRNEQ